MSADEPRSDQDRRETSASRRAHAPGRDPRDIVTEYAFQVDRGLLGVPLAGSLRRVSAMLVDLLLVAVFFGFKSAVDSALGGTTDLLIAGLAALVLWQIGGERPGESLPGRLVRWGVRASAGLVLLLASITFFATLGDDGGDISEEVERAARSGAAFADSLEAVDTLRPERRLGEISSLAAGSPDGSWRDIVGGAMEGVALARATSPEEAQPVADRLALRLHRMGLPTAEIEAELRSELASDTTRAWMPDVIQRAVRRADSLAAARQARRDSVAEVWLRARATGDTATARSMRPEVLRVVAGDSLEALQRVRTENEELEDRVDELESGAGFLRRTVDRALDEMGLGFGTLALYFTLILKLGRGRTPGKKLFGVRIVKLTGEPLTWWDAFSRYGGYWVGVVTGLLGWLQILWDPNRQALHDKIAGTVAIRTRGPGRRYEPEES